MEHSAGIILYRVENGCIYFLMSTPGGPYWEGKTLWCFPKGHIENFDVDDFEAAKREFYEETGIKIENLDCSVYDMGIIRQNRTKNVHTFAVMCNDDSVVDISSLKCPILTEIEYPEGSGNKIMIEEISGYRWMSLKQLENEKDVIKSYLNTYKKIDKMAKK